VIVPFFLNKGVKLKCLQICDGYEIFFFIFCKATECQMARKQLEILFHHDLMYSCLPLVIPLIWRNSFCL